MPEVFNHPVGHRDPDTLNYVSVSGESFDPIELKGVDIHAAIFEVPRAETLALLVPTLHPSMPSYAGLTSYRVRESVIGPFEFSVLGLACRSIIRPRMFTLASFASTDAAIELLTRHWGFATRKADIRTRMPYDAASTEIQIGGQKIVEAVTTAPEPLLGSARGIRYPQALNPVCLGDRKGLIQFDIAYVYGEAYRGPVSLPTFDAEALTGGALHPTDMIAGSFAKLEAASLCPSRMLFDTRNLGESWKLGLSAAA